MNANDIKKSIAASKNFAELLKRELSKERNNFTITSVSDSGPADIAGLRRGMKKYFQGASFLVKAYSHQSNLYSER